MFNDSLSIIGPNGSGKTLLLKLLLTLNLTNHVRLSTGDGCRLVAARDEVFLKRLRPIVGDLMNFDRFVNEVEAFMKAGQLVPDLHVQFIVAALMQEHQEKNPGKPLALDGYPRTLNQTRQLINDNIKSIHEDSLDRTMTLTVIELTLDPEVCMTKRMATQANEQERPDASPEACKERLAEFEKKTRPILNMLKSLRTEREITVYPAIDASQHPQLVLWRAQDFLEIPHTVIPVHMLPKNIAPFEGAEELVNSGGAY